MKLALVIVGNDTVAIGRVITAEEPSHRKVTSWADNFRRKKPWFACRLFGTSSLKEGAM
jgi:hypothetical protein